MSWVDCRHERVQRPGRQIPSRPSTSPRPHTQAGPPAGTGESVALRLGWARRGPGRRASERPPAWMAPTVTSIAILTLVDGRGYRISVYRYTYSLKERLYKLLRAVDYA